MQRHRGRLERTASKRWRGSVRRVVAAAIYNLSCFSHGCSTGWVSGVLGEQALAGGSWLAALPCLVALPAAPFFGVLADAKGRKAGAFCVALSFLTSWLLLSWCGGRSVWAARAAAGAGGAGALALAPLYCAEIAPRTRGLAAMPALTCSFGILFAYGAGGMLSAHALSLAMAVAPIVLLFSLLWLPETPSFLISIGRIQDAAKVMCWFDGSDFREDMTDAVEEQEVHIRTSEPYSRRDTVKRRDSDTIQPMLTRSSRLDSNSDRRAGQSACRELFGDRRSRHALVSCLLLLSVAACSGAGAIASFAAAILHHSAHSVPTANTTASVFTVVNGTTSRSLFDTPEANSMLCGVALVLGAVVATVTIDKFGRKVLLLWSCSGIACCLALLGVYCDPRVRLHAWYHQRLSLHRRINRTTLINTNAINNNVSNIYYDNLTDFLRNNIYERKSDNNDYSFIESYNNLSEITAKEIFDESANNVHALVQHKRIKGKLWPQTILLSTILFLYNIGLGSVPYLLITELLPINVRSMASTIIISWMWLTSFLTLRYYGTIAVSLGLHSVYYISASVTLLGSLYTYFCLPETKGRSQEEIDESLQVSLLGKRDER